MRVKVFIAAGMLAASVAGVVVHPAAASSAPTRGPSAGTGLQHVLPIRLGPIAADQADPATDAAASASLVSQPRIATAYTYIDDRALARKTTHWSSVAAPTAAGATLTCTTVLGQYLRSATAAGAGGAVLVQTGPGRGSVEILVNGVRRGTGTTAATTVTKKWILFSGSGVVDVKVTTSGKKVCIDQLRLVRPPTKLPGTVTRLNLSTTGVAANAGIINAAVSPGGTMVAFWSRATNLYPGVTDGRAHLFISSVATGRVTRVVDRVGTTLANDADSSSAMRGISWAPREAGFADSRFIAFTSSATNLDPAHTAGSGPYLFIQFLPDKTIVGMMQGVSQVAWSPSGSRIAVVTTQRYGADPNFDNDVWALDLSLPTNANLFDVSTSSSGKFGTTFPLSSYDPVWSPDSSKVMFESYVSTLVPGDTNASRDVFVKNLATGATSRLSLGRQRTEGNNLSESGTWSPDGKSIAFASFADNLVVGDTNPGSDVFIRNIATGAVRMVSTTSTGHPVLFDSYRPQWSPDGSRIAFMSLSPGLIPGFTDTNGDTDVYVKNLFTGLVQLVSITSTGQLANSGASLYEIGGPSNNAWTSTGKGIVFASGSTNLAAGDRNAFSTDLFYKHF